MSRLSKLILILTIISFVIPAYSLYAGELKGIKMEDSIDIEGTKLVLNGMALRKKVFWKVYVAGLYLPQKESNADNVLKADTARHLIMHWMRDVGAKKINGAWMDGLEDNTPNASPELKKQFETLCSYMEEIKEGQRMVFTYIPGKGTTIMFNKKNKGMLGGKAFADALFACWIGPDPGPGNGFKEDLMGK